MIFPTVTKNDNSNDVFILISTTTGGRDRWLDFQLPVQSYR